MPGEGAEKAGHAVRRVDLAALDFPMLRTMQEFEHGAVPDELRDAAEAIVWAEHIVFVFPLWLGTMPAMLKAFLEQVMRPGTAFAYPDKGGGFTKTLLRGRSARVVVTMGNSLPPMVPRTRHRRHEAKHPAFCRHQSGARDLVRHGRGFQRGDAGEVDPADAQAWGARAIAWRSGNRDKLKPPRAACFRAYGSTVNSAHMPAP
jgi:putative NADPH-quinone reductase